MSAPPTCGRGPAPSGRAPIPLLGIVAAGIVCIATAAADPPLLTQREAEAAAEQALRAQRWDEAIAALQQSRKALPIGSPYTATRDPRSEVAERLLRRILDELDARSAPASEHLPYWDFYVRSFPFFSTRLEASECGPWRTYLRAAARERLRAADPAGSDPRFAGCREFAALCENGDADAILARLGENWPADHADFGVCADRALTFIEERPEIGYDAGKAFLQTFPDSPLVAVLALDPFFHPGDAPLHPVALRWFRLAQVFREGSFAPDEEGENLRQLAEASGPWLSLGRESTRELHLLSLGLTHSPEAAHRAALEKIERWLGLHSDPETRSLARYRFAWPDSNPALHGLQALDDPFVTEWQKESPDDPYLAWYRLQMLELFQTFDDDRLLDSRELALVSDTIARFPEECMRPLAEWVLAEDDLRRGNGRAALERYWRIVRFDSGGARLPAPESEQESIALVRERLIDWCKQHAPERVVDLLPPPDQDAPVGIESWFCGTAMVEAGEAHLAARFRTLRDAGRMEEALAAGELLVRNAPSNPYYTAGFAGTCLDLGRVERIQAVIGELERDAEAAARQSHQVINDYAGTARLLRGCLAAVELLKAGGFDWACAEAARAVEATDPDGYAPPSDELVALQTAWARARTLHGEADALWVGPPGAAGVVLAPGVGTAAAADYLVEVVIARSRKDRLGRLAGFGLYDLGRLGTERIVARLEREGVVRWGAFGIDILRDPDLLARCENSADPALRDWARMQRRLFRRDDPWRAFILEEK